MHPVTETTSSSSKQARDPGEARDARDPGEHVLPAVVRAAAAGDQDAWRTLVKAYSRRLYAMARSRLGSRAEAEEVVQDVFMAASRMLTQDSGYDERGSFEAWLFRITMNRVRDVIRQRKTRAKHRETIEDSYRTSTSSQKAPVATSVAPLREALEQLGGDDREIIELRHHGGMSFPQIAELTGSPLGTVLARHHRALKKLRTLIETPTPSNEKHQP